MSKELPGFSVTELIENVSDMICAVDERGVVVFVTHAIYTVLGYTEQEYMGHCFIDFVVPEDTASAQRQLDDVLACPDQVYQSELWFAHKQGGKRMLQSRVVNKIGHPHFKSILVTSRDITEERIAQAAYQRSCEKVQVGLRDIITSVGSTIGARDPYTAAHQGCVADLSKELGMRIGMQKEQLEGLYLAATIHDLGKVRVPIEILTKPGRLIREEIDLIRTHPHAGYEILKDIEFPWPIAEITYQHHERLDGSGYPRGLSGDEILKEAQIISVADTVEAMANDRPYRKSLGLAAALELIKRERGKTYDSDLVDLCVELFEKRGYCFSRPGSSVGVR